MSGNHVGAAMNLIERLPLLQDISEIHKSIVTPFLESVNYQGLAAIPQTDRARLFLAGAPAHERLVVFLDQLVPQNAASALTFVAASAPFEPVVAPIIDRLRSILDADALSTACLHALSNIISQWEVGESPTDNDSISIAEALHAVAGKMPMSSAISIGRVAGQHHRKGAAAGMQSALDWMVNRLAVNPSAADIDRNVWHEAIALAIALTSKGQIHSDFAVFDDMPMDFIERMSARHAPSAPMQADPRSNARRLISNADMPRAHDMVGLLEAHCGAITGLRKALMLEQSRSMGRDTQSAHIVVTPAVAAGLRF